MDKCGIVSVCEFLYCLHIKMGMVRFEEKSPVDYRKERIDLQNECASCEKRITYGNWCKYPDWTECEILQALNVNRRKQEGYVDED